MWQSLFHRCLHLMTGTESLRIFFWEGVTWMGILALNIALTKRRVLRSHRILSLRWFSWLLKSHPERDCQWRISIAGSWSTFPISVTHRWGGRIQFGITCHWTSASRRLTRKKARSVAVLFVYGVHGMLLILQIAFCLHVLLSNMNFSFASLSLLLMLTLWFLPNVIFEVIKNVVLISISISCCIAISCLFPPYNFLYFSLPPSLPPSLFDNEYCISQNVGKGSLWTVDPDYRINLVQALRKTPAFHPYQHLLTTPPPSPQNGGSTRYADVY